MSLTIARILLNGLSNGDTVYINTCTAPTASGKHIMLVTVTNYNKATGTFDSKESEPYFGYNKNWKISDIVE